MVAIPTIMDSTATDRRGREGPASDLALSFTYKRRALYHDSGRPSWDNFLHEIPYCDADSVGRVLLDEMDALNGHLALVRPGPAKNRGAKCPCPVASLRLMTKRVSVALRLQRENGVVRCEQGPGQYMLRETAR